MSRFPFDDLARVRWSACNGVDYLTPNGCTMARTRLVEGVYVDIYNLHAQAQVETRTWPRAARTSSVNRHQRAPHTGRRQHERQLHHLHRAVGLGHRRLPWPRWR